MRKLVDRAPVFCRGLERDRFDRLLAICRAGETEINSEMVAQGQAVAFGGYFAEERAARDASRGLWAGEFMVPRDWRARKADTMELAPGWLSRIVMAVLSHFGGR